MNTLKHQTLIDAAGFEIDAYLNSLPPAERLPMGQALADGARLALVVVSPIDPGEPWRVRVSMVQGTVELHLSDDKPLH
jgi:hypothetical protein